MEGEANGMCNQSANIKVLPTIYKNVIHVYYVHVVCELMSHVYPDNCHLQIRKESHSEKVLGFLNPARLGKKIPFFFTPNCPHYCQSMRYT